MEMMNFLFGRCVETRRSAMNSLIRQAEIVLGSISGSDCGTGSLGCRTSAEDFPQGWGSQLAQPHKYLAFKNFPLLHFSAKSFWPWLTGIMINSLKTTLHNLLYLKVVFIDSYFPDLIWPNAKFTIHTTAQLQ